MDTGAEGSPQMATGGCPPGAESLPGQGAAALAAAAGSLLSCGLNIGPPLRGVGGPSSCGRAACSMSAPFCSSSRPMKAKRGLEGSGARPRRTCAQRGGEKGRFVLPGIG